MERHEEIFFSLLRSAMWGAPACVPHDFNEWGKVYRLAKNQSVLGVIANVMLSDESISSRLPANAVAKLKSFILANMATGDRLCVLLAKSVKMLKEAGIEPVLMKGQSLAAYYPDPRLRQCGDIDLYVGTEGYRKSYDVLRPIASEIDDVRKLDVGIHFDVQISGLALEVHRYTLRFPTRRLDDKYQKASDKGMSEGVIPLQFGDVQVNTPSDVFNAFYVFCHMFRHFLYEGVGFRQLCDWMMLLHARKDHINRGELRGLIESMDLMKPWQTFGCLLVEVMGLPEEEFPFYDGKYSQLVGNVARRILDEGNFGKRRSIFTKKTDDYIVDKSRSFFSHFVRTYELLSLFPKQAFRQLWHTLGDSITRVWTDVRLKIS